MPKKRVAIAINTSWNVVNFRSELVRALIEDGYEVVAVAPPDEYSPRILNLGCRYHPINMDNQGTSPPKDLLLMARYYWFLQRERPDVFLGYTAKPNIYGSIAAHALRIPVVNNIAGLGTAFTSQAWLASTVKHLYKIALGPSRKVFFQNTEDHRFFVDQGLVAASKADVLPGSGVDLQRFQPVPPTMTGANQGEMRFLLMSRLLWEKGVGEYVNAARMLKREYPAVRFQILGPTDVKNPGAISAATLEAWAAEGVIEYLGSTDDVRPIVGASDCVVLPTYYREGTPRSLLEAAAMAKPIITTDWVGSRNVVDHGVNGYLCQARCNDDLIAKMRLMIEMPFAQRCAMGNASRRKAAREFDERIIIDRYREELDSTLASQASLAA